jgi:hypothetical protein
MSRELHERTPKKRTLPFWKVRKAGSSPRNERALARNCCEMTKRTDKRTAKDAAIEKAEEVMKMV